MVKSEKFGHLHLVNHFTVSLMYSRKGVGSVKVSHSKPPGVI